MKKVIASILIGCLSISMLGLSGCSSQQAEEEIVWQNSGQVDEAYDVIVVGAEPEGVSAAVSAARNGMKTLLVEDDAALGGLMTLGQLNFIDMCEGRDGTLLTQGIFKEFYDGVGGSAFDLTVAKNWFLQTVSNEPLITLRTNTELVAPIMEDEQLVGIVTEEDGREIRYFGARVIDATVDADLAAMAGVPYTYAGEDIGEKDRQMGVTLVFELSDVNWNQVFFHLNWQRFKAGVLKQGNADMGATKKMAWGYTEEGYSYEPRDEQMRLRGFNVARQDNGNVLINALIIFGVDPLNETSKDEGIARGQAELEYIVPYIRENFVGFANAQLVGTAEQLYVRETRHIIGEYQLTIDDVLENRDQWDKIAIGAYPVDIQPTLTQTYGTVVGSPDRYGIPFRCLVPLDVDNLLVVGRSASYMSLAAGSARVIPIGMAEGEAAGVAAAYSVDHQMDFRSLSQDTEAIAQVQQLLKKQGAYLEDFNLPEPVMEHWAYPGVKTLRSLGILDSGYSNDYRLEEPIGRWRYQNMLNNVLKKTGMADEYIEVNDNPPCRQIIGTVAREVGKAEGVKYENDYQVYLQVLRDKGIMTEQMESYYTDEEKTPQAAEVIMLVANFYDWLIADQIEE